MFTVTSDEMIQMVKFYDFHKNHKYCQEIELFYVDAMEKWTRFYSCSPAMGYSIAYCDLTKIYVQKLITEQ